MDNIKESQATAPDDLMTYLCDPRVPKSEAEHFAGTKIKELQAEVKKLQNQKEYVYKPEIKRLRLFL